MADPTQPGEIIAGKYRVERVLGRGGMGMVVSAAHLALGQRVALKLLLEEIRQEDPTAEKRFDREARSAAQLRSPHVCRILDAGFVDGGTPFLAMEYLEGADLAEELGARGRLDPEEAARWVRQACEGVAEAHTAGIVHRDLKPANLFLAMRPDGGRILKVLDFGVSKSMAPTGAAELSLTKTATLVGSPIYMSPEQLRSSRDVDTRTDVWALGVILFELVTGKPPFEGENMVGLAHSILSDPHPTLEELGIAAPAGLQQVLDRALAKQPDERFPTAEALSLALSRFAPDPIVTASGAASMAVSAVPVPGPTPDDDARPSADPAPTPNGHTSRARQQTTPRWVWWVASLLISTAVAAGLWLQTGLREQANREAAGPSAEALERPATAEPPSAPVTPAPEEASEAPGAALEGAQGPTEQAQAEPPNAEDAHLDEADNESAAPPGDDAMQARDAPEPRARRRQRTRTRAEAKPPVEAANATPPPSPRTQEKPGGSLPDFGGRR